MNISEFSYMCKLSQANLKKYAYLKLQDTHDDIEYCDGFVFAKGTYPVLLVAHLDTVHTHLPIDIIHDTDKNTLSSPNGIGGDDRCGVYMILEILKKYNCSVVFCEDEEIGGKGAEKFVEHFLTNRPEELNDFNYILELDRKGNNDAVFYDNDNYDFEDFITQEYFKTSWGTFSDISIIAPFFGISAVNLSSGYHNAHTKYEYVVTTEVDTIIDEVCKLLERSTETQFEYVEYKYTKGSNFSERYYSEAYYSDESYYTVEYYHDGRTQYECIVASGEYEALGKFFSIHTDVTYREITNLIQEY